MKKYFLLFAACIVLFSCNYGEEKIRTVLDDPMTLLEDPLTVDNQTAIDKLEESYLKKEITYAEYLEKKKVLEEDYARDVQKRETLISQ